MMMYYSKFRSLMMMLLIEISECDDDGVFLESLKYDDDVADVADRKIRI